MALLFSHLRDGTELDFELAVNGRLPRRALEASLFSRASLARAAKDSLGVPLTKSFGWRLVLRPTELELPVKAGRLLSSLKLLALETLPRAAKAALEGTDSSLTDSRCPVSFPQPCESLKESDASLSMLEVLVREWRAELCRLIPMLSVFVSLLARALKLEAGNIASPDAQDPVEVADRLLCESKLCLLFLLPKYGLDSKDDARRKPNRKSLRAWELTDDRRC